MTKIIVSENGMNQEASDIMQQMRKIETIKEGIKSVRAKLDRDISTKSGIDRRLKQAYEECGEYVSVSGEMFNAIKEAVELYSKCENGIVGQCGKTGDENIKNNTEREGILAFVNNPWHMTIFDRFNLDIEMIKELGFGSALLISLDKGWDISISKLSGKDYEVELIKENLAKILQEMEEKTSAGKIPDEVKLVVKAIKEGEKLPEKLVKKYGTIIEGMGDVGKLIKYGEMGVESLEYILTDYSQGIETLEMLKSTGINNPDTIAAVDSLILKYNNKFIGSAINVAGKVIEEINDKGYGMAADLATGGLYSVVELGKDVVFEISGISDRVDAMESLMANSHITLEAQQGYYQAMDVLKSGNFTDADVSNAQQMFDLYKATKISQYENVLELVESRPRKYDNFSVAEIRSDLELLRGLEMDAASIARVVNPSKYGGGTGAFGGGEMGGR